MRKSLKDRFWNKIDKNGPIHPIHGQCWVWALDTCINKSGYATIKHEKHHILAHRLSWELTTGNRPLQQVLHKCDNRLCVRPEHLFEGNNQDNVDDKMAKGRNGYSGRKGEVNSMAILTEQQVRDIRINVDGLYQRALR